MRGEHHYEHGPTGGYKEQVPGTPNHCVPQRVELQFCQQQSNAAPLKAALSRIGGEAQTGKKGDKGSNDKFRVSGWLRCHECSGKHSTMVSWKVPSGARHYEAGTRSGCHNALSAGT